MPEALKMDTTITTFKANMSGLLRREMLEGEEYLVAPVILITVGVHNGIYYTADALSRFAEAWNGVPVPVYHPTINGIPVSANLPSIIEQRNVGRIFNARFDNGKLKAEAWINIRKAGQVDDRIVPMIEAEQRMEVSTGMFQEEEMINGVWETEEYFAIAHNIRPDHLALLPDKQGACSWEDGGGLPRINISTSAENGFFNELATNFIAFVKKNIIHKTVSNCKVSTEHLQAGSSETVTATETETQGDSNMEREAVIATLIASGDWAEGDREFLAGLADEQFAKIAKKYEVNEPAETVPEQPTANTEEPVAEEAVAPITENAEEPVIEVPATEESVITLEQFVESAPADFQAVIQEGLRLYHAERENLVKQVVLANVFAANELDNKPMEELRKLAKLAENKAEGNFEGRNVATPPKAETKYAPAPVINWKE